MSSQRKSRRGTLLLGLALVGAGVLFFFAPASSAASWMMRLWPVFLICAGVARIMGFAVERKPRSPIGGMLLVVIGVLFLASRVHPDLNAVEIYGRYWVLLLVVFGGVELVRYYSHRQSYGPAPRALSVGRIAVIVIIVATGIVASRVGRNPSVLSALRLPGWLGGLRDSMVGQTFTFTDNPVFTEVRPGTRVTIQNRYGSVKVEGGGSTVRATLTKGVSAWSNEDARETANRIKLVIQPGADGLVVTTNRDELDRQFTTDIEIQVPMTTPLSIVDSYGAVSVNNINSRVSTQVSYGQVKISRVQGDVTGQLSYSDFSATDIDGDLVASGFRRATATNISGSARLSGNNGSVEVRNISGPLTIDAPLSKVSAQDLSSVAELKTEHGTVEVNRSTDLRITAPFSGVRANDINGDAHVSASHNDIRIGSVAGSLTIEADQASVIGEDIEGEADVQTSHGAVTLKRFHEGARIVTSYREVTLVPAGAPSGNIDVSNSHGDIKLTLPLNSQFQLDAYTQNGRVRPVGFSGLPGRSEVLNTVFGVNGPTIKLRTSYRNITIQASGPGQIEASAVVN